MWDWWGIEGCNKQAKNKPKKPHTLGRYKNNLKVCIDPALVIVHIFHSPKGPIHVSLKCKGKEKRNKKKQKKTTMVGKGKPLTLLEVMSLI